MMRANSEDMGIIVLTNDSTIDYCRAREDRVKRPDLGTWLMFVGDYT